MRRTTHQATPIFDNLDKRQGAIIRKPGSKKLYVLFSYFNRRIEKSTGLDDTPAHRRKARLWLDRIIDKRDAGQLKFAEAFPGASDQEKADFAKHEGWEYAPEPKDVLFSDYVRGWKESVWSRYPEGTKKNDYRLIIDRWLLPYFGDLTFYQISGVELQKFLGTLKWGGKKHRGQPLSRARVVNILIPLRAIWNDACDQYRWFIYNPFPNLNKHLPKIPAKRREGFRFDEWQRFLSCLDPWYQPIAELMLLTGMISSEIAGLSRESLRASHIQVKNTIVQGRRQETPKTRYRIRKLPITPAIQKRLDILIERSQSDLLVTTPDGEVFRSSVFCNTVWEKARRKSGITDKVPYSLRHSFAAWALTLRIDPNKLVHLMGHGSKQMVYEVYGNYIEGLEEDYEKILNYLGPEFVQPREMTRSFRSACESFGESPVIPLGIV